MGSRHDFVERLLIILEYREKDPLDVALWPTDQPMSTLNA